MSSEPTTILLLASDLMLSSTVSGFAATAGLPFRQAASEADVVRCAEESDGILLLVDLGTPGLNVHALAQAIPDQILQQAVAYGPHVHTEKLKAAREAGFGQVMSRGQFSSTVGRLVSDAASQ